jgi:hypothetical protein
MLRMLLVLPSPSKNPGQRESLRGSQLPRAFGEPHAQ